MPIPVNKGDDGLGVKRALRPLIESAPVFAGFGCVLLYGLYRIRLGFSLSDEGLYLTAPMRYALGDVPFRDEFSNPHRMYDLILWPLFRLHPEITIYELRLCWLLIQFACVIAFYRVFKRFAPSDLKAARCTQDA